MNEQFTTVIGLAPSPVPQELPPTRSRVVTPARKRVAIEDFMVANGVQDDMGSWLYNSVNGDGQAPLWSDELIAIRFNVPKHIVAGIRNRCKKCGPLQTKRPKRLSRASASDGLRMEMDTLLNEISTLREELANAQSTLTAVAAFLDYFSPQWQELSAK